jgi:SET domain-containing protein
MHQTRRHQVCYRCYNAFRRAKADEDPIRLPSSLKDAGGGLFAHKPFRKGEKIADYGGQLIDRFKEGTKRPRSHLRTLMSTIVIDGRTLYRATIPGRSIKGVGQFCNHSQESPNAEIYKYDKEVARVYIRALRAVDAGEEITVDYGRSYRMEECSKNLVPIQLTRTFKLSLERRKR